MRIRADRPRAGDDHTDSPRVSVNACRARSVNRGGALARTEIMNATARWALTSLVVLGLAVDAYTHFDLAAQYQFTRTATVSQETLFRIEAVLALLAAVAVIVRANIWTALLAIAVAGGGLALLLVYRYVNVGQLGPIPNMYEPLWFREKSWSAAGEAVATLAALALLAGVVTRRRRTAL